MLGDDPGRLAGFVRFAHRKVTCGDGIKGVVGPMAVRPIYCHLAVLDYCLDAVRQLLQYYRRYLILGIKRLALALFVHQRLVPDKVLQNTDPAFGFCHLTVAGVIAHVSFISIHSLSPPAQVNGAFGDGPLGVFDPVAGWELGYDAAVGGDGVFPGFVGLVDLTDHSQGLPGLRVTRKTVHKHLQHVQRLDPAFFILQLNTNLVNRVLDAGIVPATGNVDFLVGLGSPERLLEIVLISLRGPQSRLLSQGMRRETYHQVIPDRNGLLIVLPVCQLAGDAP